MWKQVRPRFFLPWLQDWYHRWKEGGEGIDLHAELLSTDEKEIEFHGVSLPVGPQEHLQGVRRVSGTQWYVCDVHGVCYGPYLRKQDAAKAYVRGLLVMNKENELPAYLASVWKNVLQGEDQYDEEKGLPLWKHHQNLTRQAWMTYRSIYMVGFDFRHFLP